MLTVNTLNSSVGITVRNTVAVEDLASILMSNGYWVRITPKGENVLVEIKEDNK